MMCHDQRIYLTKGVTPASFVVEEGQEDRIMAGCSTLTLGQPTDATPGKFWRPASRSADLEIDESFDGQFFTVLARTDGMAEISEGNYDFESLQSGDERTLVVARATGGLYLLRYWAGNGCELH